MTVPVDRDPTVSRIMYAPVCSEFFVVRVDVTLNHSHILHGAKVYQDCGESCINTDVSGQARVWSE